MKRIDEQSREALAWLRFILNPEMEKPSISNWKALFLFAEKQALSGICLPETLPATVGKDIRFQWIGMVQKIECQNKLLNTRVEQLFGLLEQDGFQCCLLKGQGNAAMYPDPLKRYPGDIDIWIDADKESVYQYVRKKFPHAEESFKHIHFPIFADVSVDVHPVPLRFYSPHFRKKLQQWIDKNKAEQFRHLTRLIGTDRDISIPTSFFNVVYQLGHMLIHTYDEGVGLRQVIDYYYVLMDLGFSETERLGLIKTIKSLGLLRFARAILWVENDVLGLPRERCYVQPDARLGRRLLIDILEGGNFGKYSQRYKERSSFYHRGMVEAWHDIILLPIAPQEGMARLISKLGTAVRFAFKQFFKKTERDPVKG